MGTKQKKSTASKVGIRRGAIKGGAKNVDGTLRGGDSKEMGRRRSAGDDERRERRVQVRQ